MRRVAVTGLGVISPVGNTTGDFWESLKAGKCGIDFISKFEVNDDFKVKIAAEVKDFNPEEYMEKSEVRKTDPYVQYAIAAAKEAVEDSGIEGAVDPTRFGVYLGSGIGGMDTFITECTKLNERGPKRISPHFIPMMISNMATGRVSIKYNAQGPSLPVVTACATSTTAIGEAYRAILHGYADAIIAGGSEAAINPLSIAGFTNCMALSTNPDPKDACCPFDARRDGFIMGEGAGVIILEEYEHAVSRGATIYAEMVGYGNTSDAYHVTAPDPEAEGGARAIRQAAEEAGITDKDLVYINAHGTSTPLNDKGETKAIKKALGEDAARKALVSSTKSMTGHMLGAAGGIEAIASILALRDGIVPPTINYKEKDPECDLGIVPNTARKADVTVALSTSLGFGGHNGCVAFRKVEK